jgi:AcrR family transcriptional regulator
MSEKTDLRVRRTLRLLREAYIRLLHEKAFYKISVNALTKEAEVNRVTFYLHYRDMDDYSEQFINELLSEIEGILNIKYNEPHGPQYVLETLITLLEYIAINASIYKILFISKNIPYFTSRLLELMRELIIDPPQKGLAAPYSKINVPNDIAAWHNTSAIVGTIALWLANDMPYSPHYLAKQMVKLNPMIL